MFKSVSHQICPSVSNQAKNKLKQLGFNCIVNHNTFSWPQPSRYGFGFDGCVPCLWEWWPPLQQFSC